MSSTVAGTLSTAFGTTVRQGDLGKSYPGPDFERELKPTPTTGRRVL